MSLIYYKDFLNSADSVVLDTIRNTPAKGNFGNGHSRNKNRRYNQLLITADTETSKLYDNINDTKYHVPYVDNYGNVRKHVIPVDNKIVIWTITLSTFEPIYDKSRHSLKETANKVICTLYGDNGFEFCDCLSQISDRLRGNTTYVYFHNLSYDYEFLKGFFLECWGSSIESFFLEAHKVLYVGYNVNGKTVIFKDSYILYGAKLETFCKDMDVEHKKLTDSFEYSKVRNSGIENFTDEELLYAEYDTVGLAEAINNFSFELRHSLINDLPNTSTGIPRREVVNICQKQNKNYYNGKTAKQVFNDVSFSTLPMFLFAKDAYHGGFTRCHLSAKNSTRKLINDGQSFVEVDSLESETMLFTQHINTNIEAYDFASSYPFCMIGYKFPMGKWREYKTYPLDEVLQDDVCSISLVEFTNIRLKDMSCPYPLLQLSKTHNMSAINRFNYHISTSNGRVTSADKIWITLTNIDLKLVLKLYDYDECKLWHTIINDNVDYLPKPFRDYIWKCWFDKSEAKALKLSDSVTALRKIKLNSLYGMCVQYPLKACAEETEDLTHFTYGDVQPYSKYLKGRRNYLPYAWGMFVTSYAQQRLFELIDCIPNSQAFCYSDTDSVYSYQWDYNKIDALNKKSLAMLEASGYGLLDINGRQFLLGESEFDGSYESGIFIHSKCYVGQYSNDARNKKTQGTLKVTVAGVPPKGGAKSITNIDDFKIGFLFNGDEIRKNLKSYADRTDKPLIEQDANGDYYSFSIDLLPCDYLLGDCVHSMEQDLMYYEEFLQSNGGYDVEVNNYSCDL